MKIELLDAKTIAGIVTKALKENRDIAMVFDYDGTLTPIVDKPENARLSANASRLLDELVACEKVKTAVITGRTLADMYTLASKRKDVVYIGNHGLEKGDSKPKGNNNYEREISRLLEIIKPLEEACRGCLVENKGLSLSVHYRNVLNSDVERLLNAVQEIWEAEGDDAQFQKTEGKKVVEIRPKDINKGTAVISLLNDWFGKDWREKCLPIYWGDDTTDEDAFRALQREIGERAVTVKVGEGPSAARYSVNDVDNVHSMIKAVLDAAMLRDEKTDIMEDTDE